MRGTIVKHGLILTLLASFTSSTMTVNVATAQQTKTKSALAKRLEKIKGSRSRKQSGDGAAVVGNPTYQRMLKSVGLIQCSDSDGTYSGTGWVIDAQQRLLVTNQHVIEGFEECEVFFPEFANGRLVTDPDESIVDSRAYAARVIDSDETFDLALIQLDDKIPPGMLALELAESSATPGERIHSIAGSTVGSQSLWIYSTGHVRQVVRGVMANEYEATVLESDMATNQGNSGGPVCNDKGEVVAVVEGHANDARLVSIYVDLTSLAEYLADAIRCVDPQTAEDLEFAADRHYEEDRIETALRLATRAIRLKPEDADLYNLRGWCWYWDDDEDSAIGDFEEAIAIDRHHAESHSGLGCVASDRGEYGKAIKHFTRAIRSDPDDAHYRILRGRSRAANGDLQSARDDFDAAYNLDPESIDALHDRGIADIQLGNYEAGIEAIDETIEYFGDAPETFFFCGIAFSEMERYDEAAAVFGAASRLDPTHAGAFAGLGESFFLLERYPEASDVLPKAIELDGDNGILFYYLGVSLVGSEQIEQGIEVLRQAIERNPDNADIQAASRSIIEKLTGENVGNAPAPQAAPAKPIPASFIGSWSARMKVDGDLIQMQLQLRKDGHYDMRVITVTSDGEREDITDAGTFRVADGELIGRSNDNEEDPHRHPFRWHNRQLLLYMDEIDTWVTFSRYR